MKQAIRTRVKTAEAIRATADAPRPSGAAARLRSRRGETLGEVLVAVLVAALGLVILASAVRSSSNIVRKSKEAAEKYVTAERALVNRSASSTGENAGSIEGVSSVDGSFSVSVGLPGAGTDSVTRLTDDSADTIDVTFCVNSVLGKKQVISYWPASSGGADAGSGNEGGGSNG